MDRVVIVTGAGRGMGAACARELATLGYRVALMDRSGEAAQLADELGGLGLRGSVTETGDLERLVQSTRQQYGRIDAVVNSTGHSATGSLLEITDEEWHAGLDLLFLNIVRMARLVTPVMREQGGGAIVNISTFSAFEPTARYPVSSSLRAALAGFTKLYADQHASAGIRMNNLLPGYVENWPIDEDQRAAIPMGRAATMEEIARTVAFLLSPAAGYITGQNLRMDGGLTRSL